MLAPFWQHYDAFLFDIDGTLLNCRDAVHYFAFCDALTWLAGRPLNLDGVVTHGNTDVGILRDALRMAGVPDESWRPKLPQALKRMADWVRVHAQEFRIDVLPGVPDLLTTLKEHGKIVGVATGNLREIGEEKLRAAHLLRLLDLGGYSDDHEYRRDVFAGAVKLARDQAGPGSRLCVVGDTPEDVRAARANDLDVIAVATGVFTLEELQAEKPTYVLESLAG